LQFTVGIETLSFAKIERLLEGFCKLDATLVQVDELTRSVDRWEPPDLPPLALARRAN
jgi:hypothetical protein